MHCRNCATQLHDQAIACTQCGLPPRSGTKFCWSCAKETAPGAVVCPGCGVSLAPPSTQTSRLAAGICAVVVGAFGVHKFILGYYLEGGIMLGVTLITCGWGGIVMGVIGLVEGIIYLTKNDAEFHQL
jgi:TM2 domain-containing membrane protein YozV